MTQPPGDPTLPVGDPTQPEPTQPQAIEPQVYRPADPVTPATQPLPTEPLAPAQPGPAQPGPAAPAPTHWYPPTQGFPAQQGFPQPGFPPQPQPGFPAQQGFPPQQGFPAQPYPPSPGYPQPYQPYPPTGYPLTPPPPSGKRRSGLVIGILTGVFVLLLVGGGVSAYLLTTQNSGTGQPTAQKALDGFLTAVYTNHDATAATKYVCPQARDQAKISAKVAELRKQDSGYELPRYSWKTPQTKPGQNLPNNETVLTTTITVRTFNEQHAEQPLEFTMLDSKGWWVCEVKQGS